MHPPACIAIAAGDDICQFVSRKPTRPSKVFSGRPRVPCPATPLVNVTGLKAKDDVLELDMEIPSVFQLGVTS